MTATPTLTICVPSRNRQYTFKETIRSLVMSPRLDVQFVFADNSDDPSIMNDFMKDVIGDPRVTYLPTDDRIYPMNGNWERCVEAARGEFICVIGDDDYVDPDVASLIKDLCAREKDVDVVVWSRLSFNWPDNRRFPAALQFPWAQKSSRFRAEISLRNSFRGKFTTLRRIARFRFITALSRVGRWRRTRLGSAASISDMSRLTSRQAASLSSMLGASFTPNDPSRFLGHALPAIRGRLEIPQEIKRRLALIMAEIGRNIDHDPYMRDFPFPSSLGVAACVGQVQQWFCTTYGIKKPKGWEVNFADACAQDCNRTGSKEAFDIIVDGYREAFTKWKGGRYLKYFNPHLKDRAVGKVYFGVHDKNLHIDENVADCETPAELYKLVSQIVVPVGQLIKHNEQTKAA